MSRRQIEENSFVRAEEGTDIQQLTKEESQLDDEPMSVVTVVLFVSLFEYRDDIYTTYSSLLLSVQV